MQIFSFYKKQGVLTVRLEKNSNWPIFEAENDVLVDLYRIPKVGDYVLVYFSGLKEVLVCKYAKTEEGFLKPDLNGRLEQEIEDDATMVGVIYELRKYFD